MSLCVQLRRWAARRYVALVQMKQVGIAGFVFISQDYFARVNIFYSLV